MAFRIFTCFKRTDPGTDWNAGKARRRSLIALICLLGELVFVHVSTRGAVATGISQQQDNNPLKHDNKCWVEIYMNADFDTNGPRLLLVGPHELPTLKGLNDQNWDNDIESIMVGPEATMEVYEHPDFAGRMLRLVANQNIGNLDDAHMKNEIESLRLICK